MNNIFKKIDYRDFIGETISKEISPYSYGSPVSALREKLYEEIKKELKYSNGLICKFTDIETVITNGKITVSGIVTQCEVDC